MTDASNDPRPTSLSSLAKARNTEKLRRLQEAVNRFSQGRVMRLNPSEDNSEVSTFIFPPIQPSRNQPKWDSEKPQMPTPELLKLAQQTQQQQTVDRLNQHSFTVSAPSFIQAEISHSDSNPMKMTDVIESQVSVMSIAPPRKWTGEPLNNEVYRPLESNTTTNNEKDERFSLGDYVRDYQVPLDVDARLLAHGLTTPQINQSGNLLIVPSAQKLYSNPISQDVEHWLIDLLMTEKAGVESLASASQNPAFGGLPHQIVQEIEKERQRVRDQLAQNELPLILMSEKALGMLSDLISSLKIDLNTISSLAKVQLPSAVNQLSEKFPFLLYAQYFSALSIRAAPAIPARQEQHQYKTSIEQLKLKERVDDIKYRTILTSIQSCHDRIQKVSSLIDQLKFLDQLRPTKRLKV